VQVNRIPHRMSAGAASLLGKLYIFGGTDGINRMNDLQAWDPSTSRWTEVNSATPAPAPREGHGLVSVESSRKLYVLGGIVNISGEDRISSEFYEYDLNTAEWNNITHLNTLSARSHFGFTSGYNRLYLFGGISDGNESCALFEFNTIAERWHCFAASDGSGFLQQYHIMPGLAFSGSRLYISGGLKSSGK
jgi:N-acetylneuraminic acid mutarotase